MICYVLVRLLLPIIPRTADRVLKIFKFETEYSNIENFINNDNKITFDTENYVLPFKSLDSGDVINILKKLNIKTFLTI